MAVKIRKEPSVSEPPATWPGSRAEWAIFQALLSLGKKPGVDFIYQSPFFGGRLQKGGVVVDFLFYNPPNLAINVQSVWYHYIGVVAQMRDQMQRARLEGVGLRVIYIDEEDALRNPRFYVREALAFRDHSRMTAR
jgi:hypothetical protein